MNDIIQEVFNDAIQNLENINSEGGIMWDYVEADMCLDERLKMFSLMEICDEMSRLAHIYDKGRSYYAECSTSYKLWNI